MKKTTRYSPEIRGDSHPPARKPGAASWPVRPIPKTDRLTQDAAPCCSGVPLTANYCSTWAKRAFIIPMPLVDLLRDYNTLIPNGEDSVTWHLYHVGLYKRHSINAIEQVTYLHSQLLKGICDFNTVCFHPSWPAGKQRVSTVDGVTVHEFGRATFSGLQLPAPFKRWLDSLPKPAVFHLHTKFVPMNFALMRELRKRGISYVFTPHNPYSGDTLKRKGLLKRFYANVVERRVISGAKVVHALTNNEVATLTALGARSVCVVPNTIDEPADRIIKPRPERVAGRICYVGRLEILQKGLDRMIAVIRHLVKIDHLDVRLHLVGSGTDSQQEAIRALCQENSLMIGKDVVLEGPMRGENKFEFIRSSMVYLQLSRWEGLSLSILEAMAVGTPVVVTDVVPIQLQYGADTGGTQVPNTDEAAIREAVVAIRYLLGLNDVQFIQVAQRAQHCYNANYSSAVVANALERLHLG